jgi:type I restriction enzyme S subunit
MNWAECTLDQLGYIGRGRSKHRPRNDPILYGGEVPFIQTADIQAAHVKIVSYSQTYSAAGLAQSKLWNKPTLCMTIAGENTGSTAILDFPACFPDSIVGFIPDPDKADIRYVKYALDLMRKKFRSVSKGATQDNLPLAKILSFPLRVPALSIQKKIASIVASYDDLIENNRRRIALLEEAARMLYREWFIRFRFPGHENVKLLDGIPMGWERRPFAQIASLKYGKALKAENRVEGAFPVYGSSGIVGTHQTALVEGPTIVVGRKGNVGSIYWCPVSFWPIDTVYFVPREQADFWLYLALPSAGFQNTDAGVPGLNRDFAISRKLICPTPRLRQLFNEAVEPMFAQRTILENYSKKLAQARDLLLPRFMNGEIAT